MNKRRDLNINAIGDKDLKDVLSEKGILTDIEEGRLLCSFCESTVDWDNLAAIHIVDGEIKPICGKAHCLATANL